MKASLVLSVAGLFVNSALGNFTQCHDVREPFPPGSRFLYSSYDPTCSDPSFFVFNPAG